MELTVSKLISVKEDCDEHVFCELYRGCFSNEMDDTKVKRFAQVMLSAAGWGNFPMVAGRIETVEAHDVEQCEALLADGHISVWLNEFGWSRVVTRADVGTRYVHLENGHHRMAAAVVASKDVPGIRAPVFDLNAEETSPRFASLRP